jgi:hypothetical protein
MPKEAVLAGTTSYRIPIFVQDSSNSQGAGLTGLTHSTSSLACAYWRSSDGNTGMTTVTLATATLGTFTSGGFVAKDATNGPGLYEFGVPNAAIATGAEWVVLYFFGASNMVPVRVELQLTGYDPNDGERLGLTALPAGPMMVKKGQAFAAFTFPMTSSASHQMQTGLTVTCQISQDGGSLANSTNAVVEIGGGLYYISFLDTETNCDVMALKFSATGADDLPYTLVTQP